MRRKVVAAVAFASSLSSLSAQAWDAASTHAGLTERAAIGSRLQQFLVETMHRPLGLYEPLTLGAHTARGAELRARLARLDGAQGYAPVEGKLPALEWLVAGSVLEEVPAEQLRHHFFDAATGKGLAQGGYLEGLDLRIAGARSGTESLGEVLSGGGLDGTGSSSIEWMTAGDNPLSLGRMLDARERAVTAATVAERDAALAEALLAAGALLHLVEDAGEPALAHGDYRVEFVQRSAPFRRWVAERYGRLDVPGPSEGSPAPSLRHLADAIHTREGTGLADRAARFPSLGTVASRPQSEAGREEHGYVHGAGVRHLVAWQRRPSGGVTFTLDERCYADAAAALLPETVRSARAALEHLLRGSLTVDGGSVKVGALALGAGRVSVLADENGRRRSIVTRDVTGGAPGDTLTDLPTVEGKTIVVFRGRDSDGEPLVISVEP